MLVPKSGDWKFLEEVGKVWSSGLKIRIQAGSLHVFSR